MRRGFTEQPLRPQENDDDKEPAIAQLPQRWGCAGRKGKKFERFREDCENDRADHGSDQGSRPAEHDHQENHDGKADIKGMRIDV